MHRWIDTPTEVCRVMIQSVMTLKMSDCVEEQQIALVHCTPGTSSLGIHFGTSFRSRIGVKIPSMAPNMVDRPRLKSMTKNSTAQT